MGAVLKIPTAATPADRILARFSRDQLAGFIEVAISLLDAADDDPDVEDNGDEADGEPAEDDFWPHEHHRWGPGCPIADTGEDDDDDACPAGEDNLRLSAYGVGHMEFEV